MKTRLVSKKLDVNQAKVLWQAADQFIERAAADAGRRELLADRWPTSVERVALRHVAISRSGDSQPAVRRVVAELLSELLPLSERAVHELLVLVRDSDLEVRLVAVAALGGARDFATTVVPELIAALSAAELEIRQAAIWSLQDLKVAARPAVPALRSLAEDKRDPVRQLAIDALPWIDASDTTLEKLFVDGLDDAEPAIRAASASSLGISAPQSDTILGTLASHLHDSDYHVAFFCVWSLGRYGLAAESHAPAVLYRLKTLEWVNCEPQAAPTGPDLRSTLQRILAPIPEDEQFDDFRMEFFSHVFHPAVTTDMAWISRIVAHPWYLRMQRARFPDPGSPEERLQLTFWMMEAKAEFAQRLWKQPLLGLSPERYRELPGFVKKHCLKVASRIMKSTASPVARLEFDIPSAELTPSDEAARLDEAALLQALIEAELDPTEIVVVHCRYRDGCTIAETAAEAGLTESKVKTVEKNAISRLRRRLRLLK